RGLLVPHAAVVRCDHAEAIAARREIRIERPAAITRILPVAIAAFELVAELHFLRNGEAGRGVLDLEIASERRQTYLRRSRIGLPIGHDLLDVHRRRDLVEPKVARVDDGNPIEGREPQLSVTRFDDMRTV